MASTPGPTTEPGAREPGAPIGRDELDPELINLKAGRLDVGALAALAVLVLVALMAIRLWPDLRFSRQADTPRTVDAAGARASAPDSFVQLDARLVLSRAMRLRSSSGALGLRVAPVAAIGEALWVVMPANGFGPARGERFAGRLRPLADVAFAEALRARALAHVPRYVTAGAWRAATASASALSVRSVEGEPLEAHLDAPVELEVARPDTARITAAFTDRQADAAAWADALTAAGLLPAGQAPEEVTPRAARFVVARAGGVAAVTRALDEAGLWGATADPVVEVKASTVAALRASSLEAFAGRAVDDDALLRVTARAVPTSPYQVLLVDEAPGGYWYVLPVMIALGVIAALFAWALARAIRRDYWPRR
ncbi:MAG: hypothetical protein R2939_00695 [Kofleriaceae bacterium]